MKTVDFLRYVEQEMHSVVMATVDEQGCPVTCAVDIMDSDENGLYFLTAKGKSLYQRLKMNGVVALTGIKGGDTLSRVAISIRGKARELDNGPVSTLFEKNEYMKEIYPLEQSRQALTVFLLYEGSGEWFDLSKKPVERASFFIGPGEREAKGYWITEKCTGCRICEAFCPQGCIDFTVTPAVIQQEHCLHCGNCMETCPHHAVDWRG